MGSLSLYGRWFFDSCNSKNPDFFSQDYQRLETKWSAITIEQFFIFVISHKFSVTSYFCLWHKNSQFLRFSLIEYEYGYDQLQSGFKIDSEIYHESKTLIQWLYFRWIWRSTTTRLWSSSRTVWTGSLSTTCFTGPVPRAAVSSGSYGKYGHAVWRDYC